MTEGVEDLRDQVGIVMDYRLFEDLSVQHLSKAVKGEKPADLEDNTRLFVEAFARAVRRCADEEGMSIDEISHYVGLQDSLDS